MGHPQNRKERNEKRRWKKEKDKRISSYGYNPSVNYPRALPKDTDWREAEEAIANGDYYVTDTRKSEHKSWLKHHMNRWFRRHAKEIGEEDAVNTRKAEHKRHFDFWWNWL